jgi:hypothetical protein
MRYRVTFVERTNAQGNPTENPPDYLAIQVPDGVVLDRNFVERIEPAAVHVEEQLEEDDNFLSMGSETWEYDVVDARKDEFLDAVKNSGMVVDCEEVELEPDPDPTNPRA